MTKQAKLLLIIVGTLTLIQAGLCADELLFVTSRSATEEYDIISRFFAPAVGINEDPVTGSAHCCLAPYWSQKLHKGDLIAYQASPRGGTLRLSLRGDRVLIHGQAVTVLKGVLNI